jgi:hypothetical protein
MNYSTEVSVKTCSTCKTTKPFSGFHKNHTKADGYNHLCRDCMKAVSQAWRDKPKGRAKSLWTSSKKRADERGWEFDLTPEWIEAKLLAGVCEATGLPLELTGETTKHFRPWTPSLDRTDCTRGYTKDNVKVVCWMYNQAKGVSSHNDVIRLAKALIANDN